jgi:hypothetical protein
VCAGLGRYFGFNVTALRVFAVLLLSGGGVIVVYFALMLPMPYAPLEVGGKPLRWLPGKCRAFVEFLRTKFHLATGCGIRPARRRRGRCRTASRFIVS